MAESFGIRTFCNIEELLSPFSYGPSVEIPAASAGSANVPSGLHVQSRLSEGLFLLTSGLLQFYGNSKYFFLDGEWGYIFNRSVIRCFPISNKDIYGRHKIPPVAINTAGYHFPGGTIKSVVELSILEEKWESGLRKLLIGLDCGDSGGCLAIFDPVKGHPLRWIPTSLPVSQIHYLFSLHF